MQIVFDKQLLSFLVQQDYILHSVRFLYEYRKIFPKYCLAFQMLGHLRTYILLHMLPDKLVYELLASRAAATEELLEYQIGLQEPILAALFCSFFFRL